MWNFIKKLFERRREIILASEYTREQETADTQ